MDDQRFADPVVLADRLGALRARIRVLKGQEDALRAQILRLAGDRPLVGSRYQVAVRRSFRRGVNTQALPAAIHDDPRYWTISDTCTVTCRPLPQSRPGSDPQAHRDTRPASQRPAPPASHAPATPRPIPDPAPTVARQAALPLLGTDDDPDDIVLIEPF